MTNEELFNQNVKLAYKIAWSYRSCGVEFEDVKQMCLLGLWKAVKTFKNDKGVIFATYAVRVMQNEVNQYLRKNKKYLNNKSLSDKIKENIFLEDIIPNEKNEIEQKEEAIDSEKYLERIYKNVKTDKQKRVITMYINGSTQKKIGEKLGISQPQVSRIIKKMRGLAYYDMRTSN